ncbi:MAG: hypothetical protein P4M10_05260 [Verrucomicrobiae bacterium]|nr:hypothetical protein [Verrucomicrobiae bacterium]
MNHKMTQLCRGRQIRKISLLTELEISRARVSTNMSRRWRWQFGLGAVTPLGVFISTEITQQPNYRLGPFPNDPARNAQAAPSRPSPLVFAGRGK